MVEWLNINKMPEQAAVARRCGRVLVVTGTFRRVVFSGLLDVLEESCGGIRRRLGGFITPGELSSLTPPLPVMERYFAEVWVKSLAGATPSKLLSFKWLQLGSLLGTEFGARNQFSCYPETLVLWKGGLDFVMICHQKLNTRDHRCRNVEPPSSYCSPEGTFW